MNKQELINRVAEYDFIETKKQAGELVDDLLGLITDEVVAGNDVSLAGFGKFENFTRSNGVKTPKFRAFGAFKQAVAA